MAGTDICVDSNELYLSLLKWRFGSCSQQELAASLDAFIRNHSDPAELRELVASGADDADLTRFAIRLARAGQPDRDALPDFLDHSSDSMDDSRDTRRNDVDSDYQDVSQLDAFLATSAKSEMSMGGGAATVREAPVFSQALRNTMDAVEFEQDEPPEDYHESTSTFDPINAYFRFDGWLCCITGGYLSVVRILIASSIATVVALPFLWPAPALLVPADGPGSMRQRSGSAAIPKELAPSESLPTETLPRDEQAEDADVSNAKSDFTHRFDERRQEREERSSVLRDDQFEKVSNASDDTLGAMQFGNSAEPEVSALVVLEDKTSDSTRDSSYLDLKLADEPVAMSRENVESASETIEDAYSGNSPANLEPAIAEPAIAEPAITEPAVNTKVAPLLPLKAFQAVDDARSRKQAWEALLATSDDDVQQLHQMLAIRLVMRSAANERAWLLRSAGDGPDNSRFAARIRDWVRVRNGDHSEQTADALADSANEYLNQSVLKSMSFVGLPESPVSIGDLLFLANVRFVQGKKQEARQQLEYLQQVVADLQLTASSTVAGSQNERERLESQLFETACSELDQTIVAMLSRLK